MDKYKDFYELNDMSEQSLRNLFVDRQHLTRFNSKYADDIYIDNEKKISTYEERMNAQKEKECFVHIYKEDYDDIAFAEKELKMLNPLDVDDHYISKRIEAYLQLCKEVSKTNREKSFLEWLNIEDNKKIPFADALKKEFKDKKGKGLATMILAMQQLGLLKPLDNRHSFFESIRGYFEIDVADSGINKNMSDPDPGYVQKNAGLIQSLLDEI